MRRTLKTSVTALVMICMAGNAVAASSGACANPEDINAVRAAAVQQRLMVAAFSCHAADRYNNFVLTYRKELQASDATLERFFRKLKGQNGTAEYHAFKTRLANASSLRSIDNVESYCAEAQLTFDTALAPRKKTLAVFLVSQPAQVESTFRPCEVLTANARRPAR